MSTVLELVGQIRNRYAERRSERRRSKIASWVDLVRSVAANESPDPDSVIDILEAAGKTEADLEKAALSLQQRELDAKLVAERPAVLQEVERLTQHIEQLRSEWRQVELKFQGDIDAANAKLAEARGNVSAANHAEVRLLQNQLDPSIAEREKELRRRRTEYAPRVLALSDDRHQLELRINLETQRVSSLRRNRADPKKLAEAETALAAKQKQLANVQSELRAIEHQAAPIDAELAKLNATKLVP